MTEWFPGPVEQSRRATRGTTPTRHRRRNPLAVVLGVVGELLITAGVFLGLFVVWQLWWTDVEAHSEAATVLETFDDDAVEVPDVTVDEESKVTEDPPEVDIFADEAVFAALRVPRWGSDYRVPIAQGVDLATVLNKGYVGHYTETAMVGEVGNFSLAGHRLSYGSAFRNVDKLQVGDAIVVETSDNWYVYQVSDWHIVDPTAVEVIAPVPNEPGAEPTQRLLTLTSCHPLFSTEERYIVHAEFVYSAPKSAGTPAELEG